MPQLSRRSLLAGSGGALDLGVAGSLGRAAPADDAGTVVRIVRPSAGGSHAGIHPTRSDSERPTGWSPTGAAGTTPTLILSEGST